MDYTSRLQRRYYAIIPLLCESIVERLIRRGFSLRHQSGPAPGRQKAGRRGTPEAGRLTADRSSFGRRRGPWDRNQNGGLAVRSRDAARCPRQSVPGGTDFRGRPWPGIPVQRVLRVRATSSCPAAQSGRSNRSRGQHDRHRGSRKSLSMTWTAERVALLRSYANAGLSCAQIAAEIGVTRNAVIGKLNRLGLSRGRSGRDRARPLCGGTRREPPCWRSGWRSKQCSPPSPLRIMW